MNIAEIKTGTKLELEIYNDYGEKIIPTFASQFEVALEDKSAIIAAPIFEGIVYPVHIGWIMLVYFMQKDDLFKFKARVVSRRLKDNIALLKIDVISDIIKIQRRQYFRFDFNVPVRYRVAESLTDDETMKEPLKSTITRDISGGGVCIKLEEEVPLNKLIECEMDLGSKKTVKFYGRVVRSSKRPEDNKYGYEIGVLFKKIEKMDIEAIIHFIFQEQRKLRKKGLI